MKQSAIASRPSVFLRLGRVSNLPTVWSNTLAGAMLAGSAALQAAQLVLLMAALSAFYIAGMYLNDAFDSAIDGREQPARPIPAGEISRNTVLIIGFFLLSVGIALLSMSGLAAFSSGMLLAACIILYNVWHKNNPASPILMGICRLLVYVAAASALGSAFGTTLMLAATAVFCHITGLSYVAKQENRDSLPQLWPLILLALPVLYYLVHWFVQVDSRSLLHSLTGLALLFAIAAADGVALHHLVEPPRSTRRAVTQWIAATSLLDALALYSAGFDAGAVIFCLAAYVLTRALQTKIAGT